MSQWQPSQTDRFLEAMRRLAGRPHNKRFGPVVRTPTDKRSHSEKLYKMRK